MSVEIAAVHAALTTSTLKLAVLGNCQMGHVTRCLQAMVGGDWPTNEWINFDIVAEMAHGKRDLTEYFDRHDKVFMQPWIWGGLEHRYAQMKHKVVLYPCIEFIAYHPDLVYVHDAVANNHFAGPTGHYHSAIALLAWKAGLSAADAVKLYRRDIYRRLGYFDFWESSCAELRAEGEVCGVPLDAMLKRWIERGCFMHAVNHPKLFVMADVIAKILEAHGIQTVPGNPMQYVRDYLADGIVWPVYPEIGEAFGIPGSYLFKLSSPGMHADWTVRILGLEEFVTLSYAAFAQRAPHELVCNRLDLAPYRELSKELGAPESARRLIDFRIAALASSTTSAPSRGAKASSSLADRIRMEEARTLFSPDCVFWRQSA
ncbi:MAG: hypothetical protein K0Q76_1799 [Panacagrimonas sp.]|nr:WcbI family polysaccharide biosynthesis putative acetyltransferase [Panacagrimonas sp.]MCC2656691.1 hypothetical protein [Panacagrimonas sp.]